jgi:crotonobetaine/carnitine-CoA ligase
MSETLYHTFLQTVARWGDRPAYAVPPMDGRAYHPAGAQYTWREVADGVERMRRRYADAGYGAGHRVAMLFQQRPEFFFHYYALNALGASIVPINPDYRVDEITYVLDHSEASLAIAIDARLNDMQAAAAGAGSKPAAVSFEDESAPLPEARTPAHAGEPHALSEVALLYTSGTTGRPKGCILTNRYFHTYGSWYLSRGGRLTMIEGEERMYNPLPLHHANCLSISAPAMLISGGCLMFPDRFHPRSWWDDLVACDVTAVHMQGIIPNLLLKLPVQPNETAHRVRFGFCAGIEPSHHRAFEERFGFPVVEMWAMSETGRFITDNHEPRQIDTRAMGRVTPGLEARIVDEHDRELPPGEPGEMVLRHSEAEPRRGFFSGYLKNEEETEDAWRNGWFHTGDTVVMDETGMLFFLDRKKNIIRRAGENIAAAEVEACLSAHPHVKQAAVIAVPDDIREEEVMACIVIQESGEPSEALARDLLEWSMARMAYFKAPAWVLFVDSLPTGTSQKVQKISLFPAGVDPREQPGAIDLRAQKKPARVAH